MGKAQLPNGDTGLVQVVDAALAQAALRAGDWLVCRPGCTPCCHGAFAVNALDALRLRAGMLDIEAREPALAAAIRNRAKAWLAEHGPAFPGDRRSGLLGTGEADREAFADFADDAPCPALDPATGLCGIYAWRPMTCRVFGPPVRMADPDEGQASGDGGLGHCELCFHGATEEQIAACEMSVPHAAEQRLLEQVEREQGLSGDTVVAYCLLDGEFDGQ